MQYAVLHLSSQINLVTNKYVIESFYFLFLFFSSWRSSDYLITRGHHQCDMAPCICTQGKLLCNVCLEGAHQWDEMAQLTSKMLKDEMLCVHTGSDQELYHYMNQCSIGSVYQYWTLLVITPNNFFSIKNLLRKQATESC